MTRERSVPGSTDAADWLRALELVSRASDSHARALLMMACEVTDPEVLRAAVSNPRCPPISLRRTTDRLLPEIHRDSFALEIMIAIAWNPNTPLKTMEKITSSNHTDLKTVLCFNLATPESLLIELGETATPDMGYHLAVHPSSPPMLLDTLSHHTDTSVRDAVISNPKTPKATLDRLMGQIPDQIRLHAAARNPLMDSKTLAAWATSTRHSVRRLVAANPNLPIDFMEQLAWAGDERAQMAIASQPLLPERLAKELASNLTSVETRIALALNRNLPKHIALNLLLDPSEEVRAAVILTHVGIPLQSLVHLAYEDGAPMVQAALASKTDMPTSPLIRLVDSSSGGDHSAAVSAAKRNVQLETEVAFALHYHAESNARMALYQRPDCPPEALLRAAEDSDPRIRGSIAINPRAGVETLKGLMRDPDAAVCLLALTNPMTNSTSR